MWYVCFLTYDYIIIVIQGNKYKQSVDNWGEQLVEAKRPVLCIMDTPSGNVTVLEDIDDALSPCQVCLMVIWNK